LDLSLSNSVSDEGIAEVVALAEIDASLLPAGPVSAGLSGRVVLAAGVGVLLCGNAVVAITGCFGRLLAQPMAAIRQFKVMNAVVNRIAKQSP
jgi:hypothetical protein